uniref:F-box domain-containing protein n=1 Tax=Globisporangium ultimum (strain ATCC 200006 / CBS 805.95 / DAOM BR144) TaxID=431595 RepID=K3WFL9_GLOUD
MALFLWRDHALVRHLLLFLSADDVRSLVYSHSQWARAIRSVLRQFNRQSARLGLAIWLFQHLEIEFQSHYQELATQQIRRSRVNDPRVPPRVVSFWSERGQVEGGTVALRPRVFPMVHRDGVCARFTVDGTSAAMPMLTNVVQTSRRIYTIVNLKLRQQTAADNDEEASATILRQYCYTKEFGEWVAPPPPTKKAYDTSGALCRYDLVTQDGSLVLELDVPTGAGDSQVDYYLVKNAVVNIHMSELLQHFFARLRPPMPLRNRTQAVAPNAATGTEHFDIVTCKALVHPQSPAPTVTVGELLSSPKHKFEQLPTESGYVWLRIWDRESSRVYYHSVMLHQGSFIRLGASATLHARWLPGVLESFPTLDSRQRRCLKGQLTVVASAAGGLDEVVLVAQYLPPARLERYAASIESYTRMEAQTATQ